MKDLLIIKTLNMMHLEDMDALREKVVEQRESGTVVLPSWCDALIVPDDIEIVFVDRFGRKF